MKHSDDLRPEAPLNKTLDATRRVLARKVMIFFWAGTLVLLALIFLMMLFGESGERGAAEMWIPMVGLLLFGIFAVASTVAWLIAAVRDLGRPPTSHTAVEGGRSESPSATHRER